MQDHQRPEPKEKQTSTLKRILMLLLALAVIAGSIFGYLIPNGRADNQPVSRQEFKMLQKGNSGAAVQEMQEALQRLGYYDGKADGNFSRALEDAVRALQQDLDVSPTGKIDYDTYLLLYAELDGEAPSAAPTASPGPAAPPEPHWAKTRRKNSSRPSTTKTVTTSPSSSNTKSTSPKLRTATSATPTSTTSL